MAVETPYSKKQVNRAGKLFRDFRGAWTAGEDRGRLDPDELEEAAQAIEWWRGLHARPLGRVNAGLRYYIRKVGAEPQVTQRLKRFSTIVHKLHREPTMALSSMEGIAGVRAILPTQEQILEVWSSTTSPKASPM